MANAKKILALLLVAIMVVGLLAGCGEKTVDNPVAESGDKPVAESGDKPAAESGDKPTAEQEVVTIKWAPFDFWCSEETFERMERLVNEYIEPKIGVKLDITSEQAIDIKLALASNEDYDFFYAASWWYGYDFIRDGVAEPVNELIANSEILSGVFTEDILAKTEYNGVNYYMPLVAEMGEGYGFIVRSDILEQCGVDAGDIKTLEDMTPVLKAAYEAGYDSPVCSSGLWANRYLGKSYEYIDRFLGYDDNGNVVNLVDTAEYADYVNLVHEWNVAGYINQDELSVDNDTGPNKLTANRSVALVTTTTPCAEETLSDRYGMDMKLVRITGDRVKTDTGFSGYMINAKSEKKDAVIKFLELLYTDTYLADLMVYGEEGSEYTRDADGRVAYTEGSAAISTRTWFITNYDVPSLMQSDPLDKNERYEAYAKSAKPSSVMGFKMDLTPVMAEYTACTAVSEEYADLLEAGFYDPAEYLEKYQSALKDAGIENVIAEIQNQINAWKAA